MSTVWGGRSWRGSLGLLVLSVIGGCTDSPDESRLQGTPLEDVVTAELAAKLDADGRFRGVMGKAFSAGVTAERASVLATAVLTLYGPGMGLSDESVIGIAEGAGRPLELERLQLDDRVLFVESPYGATPDGTAPHVRSGLGPVYHVAFSDELGPAVVVSVSVHTEEVVLGEGGSIFFGSEYGNQFRMAGISVDEFGGEGAFAPETAARVAAEATGAKLVRAPEAVWMGVGYSPLMAYWKVTLDRPVVAHLADGDAVEIRELWVGPDSSIRVAVQREPREAFVPLYFLDEFRDLVEVRDGLPEGLELVQTFSR